MLDELIVYADGGSRGNPGPAAAGFILTDKNKNQLCARALFLGKATNNIAEYTAVCKALEAAKDIASKRITVFSDSELVVKQINGRYKVKNEQIRPLYRQAVDLLNRFESWEVRHIAREQNKEADKLVNRALDLQEDFEIKSAPAVPDQKPIQLGILISGGGRTMINILQCIKAGQLNVGIAVVISSRSTVAGVEKAKAAGLNLEIVRKKDYPDIDEFSRRIEEKLISANVDLVIQAGWLCLWKIPPAFENRVMNIHPALLPSFGGKGMWGHHVHEAVLKQGCKVSGCTVHFCTNEYDKGPIIIQRTCPVKETDDPETLAARVFEQECIALPETIKLFTEGKLHIQNGKVRLKS